METSYYFEPAIKGLVCKFCGNAFNSYPAVKTHVREVHAVKVTE